MLLTIVYVSNIFYICSMYPNQTSFINALAVLLLGEGIPIIYQGMEQGMGTAPPGFEQREPLWNTGFNNKNNLYVFIRMCNWYRVWLQLYNEPHNEIYEDLTTYAFTRGGKVIVIATNGNSSATQYSLSGLPANRKYCNIAVPDLLRFSQEAPLCIDINGAGEVVVPASPSNYPLVFVPQHQWRGWHFFILAENYTVNWKIGLILTLSVVPGSLLLAWVILNYAPEIVKKWCTRNTHVLSARFSSITSITSRGAVDKDTILESRDTLPPIYEQLESPQGDEEKLDEETGLPPGSRSFLKKALLPIITTTVQRKSRESMSQQLTPLLLYQSALQRNRGMVLHAALEYSIPHLGHTNDLMFGGLGKVVDMFCDQQFCVRPVALVAPLYAPFYEASTDSTEPQLGLMSQFLTSIVIPSGEKRFKIDLYLACAHENKDSRSNCFYFLLASQELFAYKTRGTIYSFDSEEQQLQFFSVFNQAIAFVISSFGIQSVQLHDNHAALSLQYIHPTNRPNVLLVLHNSDYNTKFRLGSSTRAAYIYSMFNLQRDESTSAACEHLSTFNFLYSVVHHIKKRQGGLGVVAVSPRYAVRCYHKFSMYWSLPQQKVRGILNGMSEDARVLPPPENFDAFLEEKASAKVAFQKRAGLEIGVDKLLMVFLGRITHQKGCDLIVKAAPSLLKRHPNAQMCIAGPVGDEYGAKAAEAFKKVANDFPGRVYNLAGHYISGMAKDELLLATDFFLSPSRFEPCGLADVEMAWLGSVVIGHNTGGLGKVPGFYFDAMLDNSADLTKRFEEVASRALQAPKEVLRRMSEEAVHKTFPPGVMVAAYEDEWAELAAAAQAAVDPARMEQAESVFYETTWKIENSLNITDDKRLETWSIVRAWWSNALLLISYGLFRIPSVLMVLWWWSSLAQGNVVQDQGGATWGPYWLLLIKFAAVMVVAPFWQFLVWALSPRKYVYVAMGSYVVTCILSLWATLSPIVSPIKSSLSCIVTYCISCCLKLILFASFAVYLWSVCCRNMLVFERHSIHWIHFLE